MDRIVELRKLLEHYNYLYYVKNEPVITDQKFDELMHELERLEAEHPEMFDPNSPTQRVGNDTTNEFVQVAHKYGRILPLLPSGSWIVIYITCREKSR